MHQEIVITMISFNYNLVIFNFVKASFFFYLKINCKDIMLDEILVSKHSLMLIISFHEHIASSRTSKLFFCLLTSWNGTVCDERYKYQSANRLK